MNSALRHRLPQLPHAACAPIPELYWQTQRALQQRQWCPSSSSLSLGRHTLKLG